MSLSHVGHFQAMNLVLLIPADGPQVEHMLDVFHAIDVAVDVDIVVESVDSSNNLGRIGHFHTRAFGDRTFFLFLHIAQNVAVVNGQQIDRLTRLGVNHRPDTTSVSINLLPFSFIGIDAEVAVGEETHRTLHPRLHMEARVRERHLFHLDGQSRKHPRLLDGVQIVHAESAVVAMKIGGVQQMVAQMSHEEPVREITMERLGHKLVVSNFS